jgi:maltose alpha-D-glucosyltransferase/alpha-amylase
MARRGREQAGFEDDAQWYKDAILYEVHVRAFHDSNGDGIGDFPGLTRRLDYLEELGITAIWLLPFYPSPLRDDGYDIADYAGVHPDYGTLADFRTFLSGAHRRGIRVITELVVNHTSDQHRWFQNARKAPPGSRARDFYVWSEDPERYQEARVIFQDFEGSNWTWDPVARAYFWHRFYSHQPDLNFDNPRVHDAVLRAMDHWLKMGVDGMRLDAVPYLYERDGTNCENLPETHAFLRKLRAHVDASFPNRMLLAEANQWPEDACAYFGNGDECNMAFHFPVMPRLFMAVQMEDRFPIIDIIDQTPAIPESCQWALFLRNHDELTLEMVTDEERDYMYRVYGRDPRARVNLGIRRRLAPLLGNSRRRIELLNGLLFSLPGTPIVYYGDELGMGDNFYLGDRNGVRTPMQWSPDRNAGFSRANPQRLYLPTIIDPEYHFEAINVEAQQNNPNSLLWWMRRLIALRKRYRAFGRGSMQFLYPDNAKVLAFVRSWEGEHILVVANLSRFVQHAEFDLSEYAGSTPIELFGRTHFPRVGETPYAFTLGPHTFYWFALEGPSAEEIAGEGARHSALPEITVTGGWRAVFDDRFRTALEDAIAADLPRRRWFGNKAQEITRISVSDIVPFGAPTEAALLLVRVEYAEGEPSTYAMPVLFASGESAEGLVEEFPHAAIARLAVRGAASGVLMDAWVVGEFSSALLDAIRRQRRFKGENGELLATPARGRRGLLAGAGSLEPSLMRAEQSNSSVAFGQRLILKLFRRVEPGVNPDLEIGRFLTEKGFPQVAPVAGSLEYRQGSSEVCSLAILQEFVPNEGDAWSYTLDALSRFFERALALGSSANAAVAAPRASVLELARTEPTPEACDLLNTYLEAARLLGQRIGEMHLALSSDTSNPAFVPEAFTALYQRSVHQSMRTLADRVFPLLARRSGAVPETGRAEAERVLALRDRVHDRFAAMLQRRITARRIRCHGDLHLGQVLYTGKDFVIIDFEGEPSRPVGERRIKRSPLRDVAGMLRSFHYVGYAALLTQQERGLITSSAAPGLAPWIRFWHDWACAAFLRSYLDTAGAGCFLPSSEDELSGLLDAYLLEKAIYELGYELNNRPAWVSIPLHGILSLVDAEAEPDGEPERGPVEQ